MSKKLVTPEQELIAAVIGALQLGRPLPESVDAILTTPSVQAALAKVRGGEPVPKPAPGSNEWLAQSPLFHPGDLA